MQKTIYNGLPEGFWRDDCFRYSLERLGATLDCWFTSPAGTFPNATLEVGCYTLSEVKITYNSGRGIPPDCGVTLSGDERPLLEVEARILLALEQRFPLQRTQLDL